MRAAVCRGTAPGAWELVTPLGDQPRESVEAAATLLLLAGRCRLLPAAAQLGKKRGNRLAGLRPRSNKKACVLWLHCPVPPNAQPAEHHSNQG